MLPGKTYAPVDYLQMAWRRKWLIIIPAVLAAVSTATWSYHLPDRYRATTTITIVPQQVSPEYVRSNVTQPTNERLQLMSQTILSRTRLESIIQEFNLYERERATTIMEDVVAQMRRDISFNVTTPRRPRDPGGSFTISYVSSQPRTAMLVTERLARHFQDENTVTRTEQTQVNESFLKSQLDDARRRLEDQDARLEAFRTQNAGRLPDQVQTNLSMMQQTQTELQRIHEANNLDRDRYLLLEKNIAEAAALASAGLSAPVGAVTGPAPVRPAAQRLEAAREELRLQREVRGLTDDHPDVGRAKRLIAELEAKAQAEALDEPLSPELSPTSLAALTPAQRQVSQQVASMRTEMEAIELRIASRQREEVRLRSRIADYAARVEVAPALESELKQLMRDYDIVNDTYQRLLKQTEDARISAALEIRAIGEQFRIVDNARLPERPFSPNRTRYNMMGLLAGLAFGVVLVAGLEYRDTSIASDDDVVVSLSLPVLAVIPLMLTAGDRRLRARRRMLVAGAATLAGVLAVAVIVAAWRFQLVARLDQWVR